MNSYTDQKKKGRKYIPSMFLFSNEEREKLKDYIKLVKLESWKEIPTTITSAGIDVLRTVKNTNKLPEGVNTEMFYLLMEIYKANKNKTELSFHKMKNNNLLRDYSELDEMGFIEGNMSETFNGGYRLLLNPLLVHALDELQRGRSTLGGERKKSALAIYVGEHIPSSIRSLLKKGVEGQKIKNINGQDWIPAMIQVSVDKDTKDVWFLSTFKFGTLGQFE